MTKALPSSLLFHLAVLLLVFLFGTFVDKPQLTPPRVIRVQMVTEPKKEPETTPVETSPETPPETRPEVRSETLPVEAEPEPRPVPEQPKIEPPETEPEVAKPVEKPLETQPDLAPATEAPVETVAPQVSSVTQTDQEIPAQFQYYITLLQGRVARNWNPKRLGFREGTQRVCVVHFTVERDGRVTRESVEKPSGVNLFDQEALSAVRRVGRMPPLPAGITGADLGVHFTFTLETGP